MECSEIEIKRQEYRDYIIEHQNFVKKAYLNFEKINSESKILSSEELNILKNDINHHDDSKFDTEEFEGYRIHYYPCSYENNKDQNRALYLKAKIHHYNNNDHHPQHPSRKEGLNKVACIHNILDWIGMSYKYKDDVWTFYNGSSIRENLNPEEKIFIEDTLELFKKYKSYFYKIDIDR